MSRDDNLDDGEIDVPSVDLDVENEVNGSEQVVILAFLVNWCGCIPDCRVLEQWEEICNEIIFESGRNLAIRNDGTIIIEPTDRQKYVEKIPRGCGTRGVVDGICFLRGDFDESVCLKSDVSEQANPEVVFGMDGEHSDVIITRLPMEIADRIRYIRSDTFSEHNVENSLCLPREFSRNANGMSG